MKKRKVFRAKIWENPFSDLKNKNTAKRYFELYLSADRKLLTEAKFLGKSVNFDNFKPLKKCHSNVIREFAEGFTVSVMNEIFEVRDKYPKTLEILIFNYLCQKAQELCFAKGSYHHLSGPLYDRVDIKDFVTKTRKYVKECLGRSDLKHLFDQHDETMYTDSVRRTFRLMEPLVKAVIYQSCSFIETRKVLGSYWIDKKTVVIIFGAEGTLGQ